MFSYSYSTTNSIDINKIYIQIPNINFINKTIIEQQEKIADEIKAGLYKGPEEEGDDQGGF